MHIIQEDIGAPKVQLISSDNNSGVFCIEPLPHGYGMTLGNGLRRVMLSSLPGVAIVAVRFAGGLHEYSAIKGVKDSVLDIILNLKNVNFKKHSKGREIVFLEKQGSGEVKAADIQTSSDVEILNPDYCITHIADKNSSLKIEIVLEKNVGYSPAKERINDEDLVEFIHVDALFSPVSKVRYDVQSTRVGENTDLDKLIISVETNGAMTPDDSIKFSANLLKEYFSLFDVKEEKVEADFMSDFSKVDQADEEEEERESYTPIEILGFSPRTLNSLINGDIGSTEQLVKCTPSKLQSLRGFGKKAMDEVIDALSERGLSLSVDE